MASFTVADPGGGAGGPGGLPPYFLTIGQSSPGIFMKNIKAREFIISIKTDILFKINLMFRKLYIYRLLAGVAVETLLANETLLVEMLLSKREREALSHP